MLSEQSELTSLTILDDECITEGRLRPVLERKSNGTRRKVAGAEPTVRIAGLRATRLDPCAPMSW
jgi:hypothetical protein